MKFSGLGNRLSIFKSKIVKNSFWGLVSKVLQTLFLSVFFVIISRYYPTYEFANFLIATTIYQFMVGISSMGLGTWFIREFGNSKKDKFDLTSRFIKIQVGLGILFYLLNIVLVFILYQNSQIRVLGLILGTNIIFDNIIYALSSLNTAQFKQKKTAVIMALDALVRLLMVSILFLSPFSILFLSFLLVLVRLFTVNIFLRIGIAQNIGIKQLWKYKLSLSEVKSQIFPNWRFVLIVGLSIIFWKSGTIIISKFLTASDVANYEVAFKIFTIFNMLPLIVFSTVFPQFVKFHANNDLSSIRKFYKSLFIGFAIFSLTAFAFIQSFSEIIIALIFGNKYALAVNCLKEMFLTFLVFPTVLLQANLILAMKLEKLDMYFNLLALGIFLIATFVGLYFYKSLSVINYSIFSAVVIFHIAQAILLYKLKVSSFKSSFIFYSLVVVIVLTYQYLLTRVNPTSAFLIFGSVVALSVLIAVVANGKNYLRPFYSPNMTALPNGALKETEN